MGQGQAHGGRIGSPPWVSKYIMGVCTNIYCLQNEKLISREKILIHFFRWYILKEVVAHHALLCHASCKKLISHSHQC